MFRDSGAGVGVGLPAIRERAQAWQEEQAAAARRGWKWTGPPEVPGLCEEVAWLLALVARLQGERNSLRAAVDDYHGWITKARELDPDSQECRDAWIEAQCAEGRLFAARAALGED